MKSAILLLNFGGPTEADDVEPFLHALLADRDAIRLPVPAWVQERLAGWISARRAPRTRAQYAEIGGGSPLIASTRAQARVLAQRLRARGVEVEMGIGMRYTEPSISAALEELLAGGCDRLILLPLYPQYSIATTGSAFNAVVRVLRVAASRPSEVHFIPAFYRAPEFIAAHAERIAAAMRHAPPRTHLLFSAHGLPVSYVRKARDPYLRQTQETVSAILAHLELFHGIVPHAYHLAWQSRVGPARWLAPPVEGVLQRLGGAGVNGVVVAPISFVNEHIETLYEIDILFAAAARTAGIPDFRRVKGVADHPGLISAWERILLPFLEVESGVAEKGIKQICERCLLPPAPACRRGKRCCNCGYRFPEWRRYAQA